MKKILLSIIFVFALCAGIYSLYAQGSLEGRQLGSMCEKIQAYEEECGIASPAECKSNNKEVIDNFMGVCFFSNTTNSLACIKRINWLYADMFANNQVEPCKTSLAHLCQN